MTHLVTFGLQRKRILTNQEIFWYSQNFDEPTNFPSLAFDASYIAK